METVKSKPPRQLEKGQLWKLEHGYLHIVELGKRFIHYELRKEPNETTLMSRLIGIDALAVFLRHSEAELVAWN